MIQAFWIGLAVASGTLALAFGSYGVACYVTECKRPVRSPEMRMLQKMPCAKLTRAEYKRIMKNGQKIRTRLGRSGFRALA